MAIELTFVSTYTLGYNKLAVWAVQNIKLRTNYTPALMYIYCIIYNIYNICIYNVLTALFCMLF